MSHFAYLWATKIHSNLRQCFSNELELRENSEIKRMLIKNPENDNESHCKNPSRNAGGRGGSSGEDEREEEGEEEEEERVKEREEEEEENITEHQTGNLEDVPLIDPGHIEEPLLTKCSRAREFTEITNGLQLP